MAMEKKSGKNQTRYRRRDANETLGQIKAD